MSNILNIVCIKIIFSFIYSKFDVNNDIEILIFQKTLIIALNYRIFYYTIIENPKKRTELIRKVSF